MKNVLFIVAITGLSLFTRVAAQSLPSEFIVVPASSLIKWTGYYLFSFGEHSGTVAVTGGSITADSQEVLKGSVSIDMRTVKLLDTPEDEGGKDIADHLMSKDFFDAAKYPQARMEIIKSEPISDASPGNPNTRIFANLTIKNITQPVKFDASVTRTSTEIKAAGKFKFDRTRWGIEYNSGKVFSEVGDGAISDAVAIEFSINAKTK